MKLVSRLLVLIFLLASLLAAAPPQPAHAASGATITVNTNSDADAVDGFCSLREAILAASANSDYKECSGSGGYGDDSIVFNISGSPIITLTSAFPAITTVIYIDGFNSGNRIVIDGDNTYQPFSIGPGGDLTLENLTIQKGYATPGGGGAIDNSSGSLTIINSVFTQNRSLGSGGAVGTFSGGTTTIKNSSFYNNQSIGADGGAIANYGTPVSTTTIIINSTIFNNTAPSVGAVINNAGTLYIYNSTLSSNSSSGIVAGSLGTWNGTGIPANDPVTYVYNSILANSTPNDCFNGAGTINGSHNIVESQYTTTCSGIILTDLDPGLGTATGSPPYLPITFGSSAMDAGDNATCAGGEVNNEDQRGFTRPVDGDGNSTATCDIGAFEFAPLLLVDDSATSGTNTGLDWANAFINLQDALNIATNGTEIWAASGVYYPDEGSTVINDNRSATFNLRAGVKVYGGFAGFETARNERDILSNVTILSGDIDKDDINTDGNFISETTDDLFGSNAYHVVTLYGVSDNTILDGFTITGGYSNASGLNGVGAGILLHSSASPTLENLTVAGNLAVTNPSYGYGGGVYMEGSSAPIMTNMYITGNKAVFGGGVFSDNSDPIIHSVTIADNKARYGGGVEYFNGSGGSLTNVTIFNNQALDYNGGGFYNADSSPLLTNVTIAHNSALATNGGGFHNIDTGNDSPAKPILVNVIITDSIGGDCVTSLMGGVDASLDAASGYNLIEDSINACGLTHGVNGNKVGVEMTLFAPSNNGGYTPTMMLPPESPARNAGTNTSCPVTDQRGRSRALTTADPCDMGAYELQAGKSTFTSNGAQDGWILESSETSNKGGTKNNTGTTLQLGDDALDRQYRSILSFDTSPLNDTAVVYKVTLKLKRAGKPIGGGNPVSIFQGFIATIKTGTFGTSPLALGDFKAAGNKVVGPTNGTFSGGWYTLNLDSASLFINRLGSTQIRLQFKKDDNDNALANILKLSSGNAGAASRPQLIVEYYVP